MSDGHDGGDPTSIVNGDNWLSKELPKILDSAAYKSGKTVVFVTWDEGEPTGDDLINGDAIGRDCSADTTHADCHIATIVISPFTKPGTQYGKKPFNHYSMLRTTEELLKIKKKNWVGLSTKAKSMKSAFHSVTTSEARLHPAMGAPRSAASAAPVAHLRPRDKGARYPETE